MVNKVLLHPQEIETFYVLPTLRRYFALYLKEKGMMQKDVAELLGITTSTISQYTSTKRAHQINFKKDALEEIKKSALRIKDRGSYLRETQYMLHFLRSKNIICEVHKRFSKVPHNCEPKSMGCFVNDVCMRKCGK